MNVSRGSVRRYYIPHLGLLKSLQPIFPPGRLESTDDLAGDEVNGHEGQSLGADVFELLVGGKYAPCSKEVLRECESTGCTCQHDLKR